MTFQEPVLLKVRKSRLALALKTFVRTGEDWLVPIRRVLQPAWRPPVLFQVSSPFGFDSQEPVIRSLAERGRVETHVAGGIEAGVRLDRLRDLAKLGVETHATDGVRHRRFEAIVVTDLPLSRPWRSSRYVYLHHGSSYANRKVPYAFEVIRRGDASFLLALHPIEVDRARETFGEAIRGKTAVVGAPKLDRLVAGIPAMGESLSGLGLVAGRRTVLVLSHWTETALLHNCGAEILQHLRSRRDCNVLVTAHHHLWREPVPSVKQAGLAARLAWIAAEPHMRLLPRFEDMTSLMLCADLAIGDHTSAMLEYATLFRPMLVYRHPDYEFADTRLDALLRRTAGVFTDAAGYADLFDSALAQEACDRQPRTELLDECFSHLGRSAKQAAAAVELIAHYGRLPDDFGAVRTNGRDPGSPSGLPS